MTAANKTDQTNNLKPSVSQIILYIYFILHMETVDFYNKIKQNNRVANSREVYLVTNKIPKYL